MNLRETIKHLPIVGPNALQVWRRARQLRLTRFSSADYWDARYASGGNSGTGSYGHLAEFKAAVLNDFVVQHQIGSVIEFGCGDGHQLSLAKYPQYLGIDVSPAAIKRCQELFQHDKSKRFVVSDCSQVPAERADLALSLDVIYHLVEDDVYEQYMHSLFDAANRFVIIYSDDEEYPDEALHVRHRRFTDWVGFNRLDWRMVEHIPNNLGSWADFWIYATTLE
jgi:SAM-dependent methyltransferase